MKTDEPETTREELCLDTLRLKDSDEILNVGARIGVGSRASVKLVRHRLTN